MTHNLAKEPNVQEGILPLRVNNKRKKMDEQDYNPNGRLPAPETVLQYVKACFDLFKQQKADRNNRTMLDYPALNLRSPELTALLNGYVLEYCAQLTSRDSITLNVDSGYEKQTLSAVMWDNWQHRYNGNRKKKLYGSRQRLSTAWLHFMMSRGENLRMARLGDLFSHAYDHPEDGYQFTLGVILKMLRGKTNRDGKAAFGSVVRNKDVQTCPVGALAFYLFERFTVSE